MPTETALERVLKPTRGVTGLFDWYVDSINGNDNNNGRTPEHAFATLAKLATCGVSTSLNKIGLAANSVFRETFMFPVAGLADRPIILGAYGSGAKPQLLGSMPISATAWTNLSGQEYTTPTKLSNPNSGGPTPAITWIDPAGLKTSIYKGKPGSLSANQYVIANGLFHVNIGRVPVAGDVFEVGQRTPIDIEVSHTVVDGLDIRYSQAYGIQANVTAPITDTTIQNCELSWNTADAINFNAGAGVATNSLVQNCWIHDQPVDGGGGGDGFSGHGATTGKVISCLFQRCGKNGFNASEEGAWTVYDVTFDACDCIIFGGSKNGGPHYVYRCQFYGEKPGGNASQPILYFQPGHSGTHGFFYNNSIARGTGSSDMRGIRQDDGVLAAYNNSVWGVGTDGKTRMSFGFLRAGGALTQSNNAAGQCVVDAAEWYGPAILTLTSQPYTSYTASSIDLVPRPGSQLLGAGVVVPDYTVGNPPDIGFTGAKEP